MIHWMDQVFLVPTLQLAQLLEFGLEGIWLANQEQISVQQYMPCMAGIQSWSSQGTAQVSEPLAFATMRISFLKLAHSFYPSFVWFLMIAGVCGWHGVFMTLVVNVLNPTESVDYWGYFPDSLFFLSFSSLMLLPLDWMCLVMFLSWEWVDCPRMGIYKWLLALDEGQPTDWLSQVFCPRQCNLRIRKWIISKTHIGLDGWQIHTSVLWRHGARCASSTCQSKSCREELHITATLTFCFRQQMLHSGAIPLKSCACSQ